MTGLPPNRPAPSRPAAELVIDDRLHTVLASPAPGREGARIQYRQLIDLLGRMPPHFALPAAALDRLDALDAAVPADERAAILRSAPASLRHPGLILRLAAQERAVAAAAVAAARLDDWQWTGLIAELPVAARGFLRHRRDLGPRATAMLARLGVMDLGLPQPEAAVEAAAAASAAELEGIGAIVRRIEAFRRSRQAGTRQFAATPAPLELVDDPRLPLSDAEPLPSRPLAIRFASDADGRIVAAEDGFAPMLAGLPLGSRDPLALARCDAHSAHALRQRRPVRAGRIELDGAPAIAGAWQLDAAPRFDPAGGRFLGYRGVLRRPAVEPQAPESAADRLRQLLHELRTPVNAIQGFAELIQQQLFGPAPNHYRSLAARIAADAAAVLAGFEEIDRLARLETGRAGDFTGHCDLVALLERAIAQLGPATAPREVRLELDALGPAPVALAEEAAERLLWRLLAALTTHAAPGETLALELAAHADGIALALPLPAALAGRDEPALFAVQPAADESAALLGGGFALRLARAEARAAGGALELRGDHLSLRLPGLTPPAEVHSPAA